MNVRHRTVAAAASVGTVTVAMLAAVALGPGGPPRLSLFVFGLFAVAMSITGVVANPRDLLAALVLGLPPVMALGSADATAWMIAPMTVLLLIGGELNAFCWELEGPKRKHIAIRRRLAGILQLSLLGLVASAAVTVAAQRAWLETTAAVAVAAGALVGLAFVILPSPPLRAASAPSDRTPPARYRKTQMDRAIRRLRDS